MTKELTAVIADDELPARNELNFLLSDLEGIQLIGEAADGLQALELIRNQQPEVAFLDIQMPGLSGLEVAQEVQNLASPPVIVFITAYDEYALDAFQVNAVDYILKPFSREELAELLPRLINLCQQEDEQFVDHLAELVEELADREAEEAEFQVNKLPVYGAKKEIKLLDYDEIIVCYTKNSRVIAKTDQHEYEVKATLKELEAKLPADKFFRVHRSFLVNLRAVKEIVPWFKGKYQLIMDDEGNKQVPVSRSKVDTVKEIFGL